MAIAQGKEAEFELIEEPAASTQEERTAHIMSSDVRLVSTIR